MSCANSFLGPLPETAQGNKYIVTVTDYFSKWPEAAPLPDKTSTGVADFLFSVFCRHGWPETIISDQGREFINVVTRFEILIHDSTATTYLYVFLNCTGPSLIVLEWNIELVVHIIHKQMVWMRI